METLSPSERASGVMHRQDSGPTVLALQQELNNAGYGPLLLDGVFGAATERVVMDAQKVLKHQVTGVASLRILASLGMSDDASVRARRVVQSVWDRFSDSIIDAQLDYAVSIHDVLALVSAENEMRGVWKVGLPVLRFDIKAFRPRIPSNTFGEVFRDTCPPQVRDAQTGEWHTIHSGRQATEYFALSAASVHDLHAAHESCQMGAAMIPGSAYKTLGYATALDMFVGFGDEREQVSGLVGYALSQPAEGTQWAGYAAAKYPERADAFRAYLSILREASVAVTKS